MRALKLVLPLITLVGGLIFTPRAFPVGHSVPVGGKQPDSKQPPKNAKAEQPVSKKESRMNQRDREMDKRMKQQKVR